MVDKTIVYILGAGASAEDGAPVTNKLVLYTILYFWSQEPKGTILKYSSVLEEMDEMFKTNCKGVMDEAARTERLTGNWADACNIDVEKFLTEIENKSKNCDRYKELRKKALYFIFHPLCCETNKLIGNSGLKHYTAFVDKVLKPGARHCIVTFNYDTLLERAICNKCFTLPQGLPWTYAVNFTPDIPNIPYYSKDESIAEIFLLKLHGSFNWGWCPETKEITMYPLADILQFQKFNDGQNTWYPGRHKQEPLLIPPTREKNLNIPALRQVWKKAKRFLRQATELHIIGYSAPEADIDARKLFSEILKPRASKLEKIVLANKSANSRIMGLINGSDCTKLATYNTFADYLDDV